jgi:hypothetical protein
VTSQVFPIQPTLGRIHFQGPQRSTNKRRLTNQCHIKTQFDSVCAFQIQQYLCIMPLLRCLVKKNKLLLEQTCTHEREQTRKGTHHNTNQIFQPKFQCSRVDPRFRFRFLRPGNNAPFSPEVEPKVGKTIGRQMGDNWGTIPGTLRQNWDTIGKLHLQDARPWTTSGRQHLKDKWEKSGKQTGDKRKKLRHNWETVGNIH